MTFWQRFAKGCQSIARGMSTISIFPPPIEMPKMPDFRSGARQDKAALARDFRQVGDDLRHAVKAVEKQFVQEKQTKKQKPAHKK